MGSSNCPVCHSHPATIHQTLGVLPCKTCSKRQSQLPAVGKLPEFTSDSIKHQRKEFAPDIEQPHRKGELNKAWLDARGEKAALNYGFSKEEIKKAKYVYRGDDTYYK